MKSFNFEFLRSKRPELAALGGFAEHYAHSDAASALIKLRTFAEQTVLDIYHEAGWPKPFQWNLHDLLNESTFQDTVPRVVSVKLHWLRKKGNAAAHGGHGTTEDALYGLREAFDLGCWFFLTFDGGTRAACPVFTTPSPGGMAEESKQQLKREKKVVLERLAAQEAEMQRLLADLEEARLRAQHAQRTADELQHLLAAGHSAVDALHFNEAETRRHFIDDMLATAGWPVGPRGSNTELVVQESGIESDGPASGVGYTDYILKNEQGKPVAVVEVKKTAKNAEEGRTQAKLYADGLERLHGQRPIIFYTNGIDVFLWNDGQGEPPRKVYGFYSPDSLQYLQFQAREKIPSDTVAVDHAITDRIYQIEAIKRVVEQFASKRRRALIVQATGTGKTRVAVALCDALLRARWVKRILFVCDRRELRKQATNVFKRFLPSEPRTIVTADTAKDRDKRIYLATYPAMMKCFETFDVGFFDLIIADESHRSIYNRYRDLFLYFDALQVGLTATPVHFISRNTYRLFGCEDQDPTAHFSFEEAVNHQPPYLVPYEVYTHTTQFQRDGIRWKDMTPEQRRQLEDDETNPQAINFDAEQMDKRIFNKDTNRAILRNLMENGVRDATGNRPGKTIIFARGHQHALLLQKLFEEMYPQYGGDFCRVIDNYDPRAEQLIDDFKGEGHNPDLTIAISVDMLDTGIDVPEVVNLVFAKPVRSYVKFWQMIGRGTRLCPNLFGPGRNKSAFRIFDHWGNFEFFGETYVEAEPSQAKSLLQRLFEARIDLAETAVAQGNVIAFDLAVGLLRRDLADLPEQSIAVRDRWRDRRVLLRDGVLEQFEAATKAALRGTMAPLMQWRDVGRHAEAFDFDLLVARLQSELLKQSSRFPNLKDDLTGQVRELQINLTQVRAKAGVIEQVQNATFWNDPTVAALDQVRDELRGIMQFRRKRQLNPLGPKIVDVKEDRECIEHRRVEHLAPVELAAYRARVEEALRELFDDNQTLQKIKAGEPVTEADLEALNALVLAQNPDLDLHDLLVHYQDTAADLAQAIRGIIGLDAAAVHQRFTEFVHVHPHLSSTQLRFLSLLQNHISRYGSIEVERLYDSPFTLLHSDGLDGVFPDEADANELLAILTTFRQSSVLRDERMP